MRQFALFMLSMILIISFYQINLYKVWIDRRVINYSAGSIGEDIGELDTEERRKVRFGPLYKFCEQVKEVIKTQYPEDKKEPPLLLLPPQELVKLLAPGFTIPEPLIFYYMTGLHSTYPGGQQQDKANCALMATSTKLIMINSKADIDSMLNLYKIQTQQASKK